MDDSFSTYINQFLVDPSSAEANSAENAIGSMDVDKANSLGNELLLQLLLNGVNADSSAGLGTVDPSTLTSFQMNSAEPLYTASTDGSSASNAGATDANALLTEAFLSSLGPFPFSEQSAVSESQLVSPAVSAVVENSEPMAVDTVDTTSAAAGAAAVSQPLDAVPRVQKTRVGNSKPTASGSVNSMQKKSMQQQAPSVAAGKRVPSSSASPSPSTVVGSAATASAPKNANAPSAGRAPGSSPPARNATTTTAAAAVGRRRGVREESPDAELDSLMEEAASDELVGVDLKSMSSKERRQLRNKISARNFRVRRKEYISNLEAEVRMHKEEADGLRKDLVVSKKENQQLRDEIQKLRQRLGTSTAPQSLATTTARTASGQAMVQKPIQQAKPVAKMASSLSSAAATPTATAAASPVMAPAAAPMVRFNPHKDIGQAAATKKSAAGGSSAAAGGSWAAKSNSSGYITVNTTMLPVSFSATFDALAAEARRKQAVDALLDMGDDAIEEECSADSRAVQIGQKSAAVLFAPAMLVAAAGIFAELLLPQMALELSLSQPQQTAASDPPCAAIQC
ncbi:hypothetical protein LPJ72_003346 [Coemansia sp. Benny D160-2]|nr:hypothetical protein LPJ72_003346 [Coemansia sp. Benny D160-2]